MLACNHAPAVDNSTPALRRILWREYHVYGQTAYRRLALISLLPVLEAILHQFPFRIRGFHSDNGSEFLNRHVAKLLHKLLISEFTKSRAHRTTDNALVEGKNGAVVRKDIGHEPIAAEHAAEFQRFYLAYFNPYLNYHRPCGFATVELNEQGKRRRHYRLGDYRTPYEKLISFPLPLEHPQKGDPHAAPALCPTNPISGSFLDWKMLQPQKTRATSK